MAILFLLISSFCYAVLNSIIKLLGSNIGPLELLFYRNLFAVITLLPLVPIYTADLKLLLQKKHLRTNLIRGSLGFIGICFWFIAIRIVPLTECVALSFTTPLFVTIISVIILKEKMSLSRWISLFIGFSGAIIIISPNFMDFNLYGVLVLIAAFFWASSVVVVKGFINYSHPIAAIFFTSCINLTLSSPVALNLSSQLNTMTIFMLCAAAIISNIAQVFMAFSYKNTPISIVIPFDFMRLVFSIPLAFFLFDEVVTISTVIGSIIILGNSSFLTLMYRRKSSNIV